MRIIGTFTRCKKTNSGEADKKKTEFAVISGLTDSDFNARVYEMFAENDVAKYTPWRFKSIAIVES